jgi:hypothetical protein
MATIRQSAGLLHHPASDLDLILESALANADTSPISFTKLGCSQHLSKRVRADGDVLGNRHVDDVIALE